VDVISACAQALMSLSLSRFKNVEYILVVGTPSDNLILDA
jgi:hypothetical protein